MGYTHYWYRPAVIPAGIFGTIRADFERLILPLADSEAHLADGLGEGVPVITDDVIHFNGVKFCGHPSNDAIAIPFPTNDACGIGPSANAIQQNGSEELITRVRHRCCDGRCSYETFNFPRCLPPDDDQPGTNGLYIGFTKTAFRPYDIAVTATLLIAKKILGDQFVVHTDGLDAQWSDAKRICQQVLGYGEWFGVVEEPVEEQWPGEAGTRTTLARTLIEMRPPMLA